MKKLSPYSDRQPWKSREPHPLVLQVLRSRSIPSQREAASTTTLVDGCLDRPQFCGQCGQSSEPGARFCGQCGKQFVPGATILVSLTDNIQ
jgi:hypothetical protein